MHHPQTFMPLNGFISIFTYYHSHDPLLILINLHKLFGLILFLDGIAEFFEKNIDRNNIPKSIS